LLTSRLISAKSYLSKVDNGGKNLLPSRLISAKSHISKIPTRRPFQFKPTNSPKPLLETDQPESFNNLNLDLGGNPIDLKKGLENSFYKNVTEFEKGLKFRNAFGNDSIFYPAINYLGS
jgi:hypothetical protein